MKALRYHILLATMAGGILFVLFNLMPNRARFDVADVMVRSADSVSVPVAVPVPVGAGQGVGVTIGY